MRISDWSSDVCSSDLLLLARLGLRAGDIVAMQLDDIYWDQGTVRVSGKSIRPALLPLPQDAGEAILAYIEHVRPTVPDKHLFLRIRAPYRSFAHSRDRKSVV